MIAVVLKISIFTSENDVNYSFSDSTLNYYKIAKHGINMVNIGPMRTEKKLKFKIIVPGCLLNGAFTNNKRS